MAGHTVEDLWSLVKPHQPPAPRKRQRAGAGARAET